MPAVTQRWRCLGFARNLAIGVTHAIENDCDIEPDEIGDWRDELKSSSIVRIEFLLSAPGVAGDLDSATVQLISLTMRPQLHQADNVRDNSAPRGPHSSSPRRSSLIHPIANIRALTPPGSSSHFRTCYLLFCPSPRVCYIIH